MRQQIFGLVRCCLLTSEFQLADIPSPDLSYKLSDGVVVGNLGANIDDAQQMTARLSYEQTGLNSAIWALDLGDRPVASAGMPANVVEFTFRVTADGSDTYSEVTIGKYLFPPQQQWTQLMHLDI